VPDVPEVPLLLPEPLVMPLPLVPLALPLPLVPIEPLLEEPLEPLLPLVLLLDLLLCFFCFLAALLCVVALAWSPDCALALPVCSVLVDCALALNETAIAAATAVPSRPFKSLFMFISLYCISGRWKAQQYQ
jgi:hypothetical protein